MVVVWGALALAIVFVVAAVAIGREAHRLDAQPPSPPVNLDEEVAFVAERLPFEVSAALSYADVRTILEWQIAPRLRQVRGVTEINSHGGYYQSFEVRPDPDRLASFGVSLQELFHAISSNNGTAGGGYVVVWEPSVGRRGRGNLPVAGRSARLCRRSAKDAGAGSAKVEPRHACLTVSVMKENVRRCRRAVQRPYS